MYWGQKVLRATPTERDLQLRLVQLRWVGAGLVVLALAALAAASIDPSAAARQLYLGVTAGLGLLLPFVALAHHRANARLGKLRSMEIEVNVALRATSSKDALSIKLLLNEITKHDRILSKIYSERSGLIEQHIEALLESEVLSQRRRQVAERCANAKRTLFERVERQRLEAPAIRAMRNISDSIDSLKKLKASAQAQLDAKRGRLWLTWWHDLAKPSFAIADDHIRQLEAAQLRLHNSGKISRTNDYFRTRTSVIDSRIAAVERSSLLAIPPSRREAFDDQAIVHNALLLAAFSVPISAWLDVSQAGGVYESLREVNGNFANMGDTEIWLETLTMTGSELAGLANLTKGSLFERLVEADFGGERFEHFNNPDADIIIDGVAHQIKATDSSSYVEGVSADIPVISTSEVAEITGAIDGGYTNQELADAVDLALGGTVVDFGDTAFDAMLTGIGGVGIIAILKGAHAAHTKYQTTGNALESLVEGVGFTVTTTAKTAVTVAEVATKSLLAIIKSPPMRLLGKALSSFTK